MRKFERTNPPPEWVLNETRWNEQWVTRLQATPGAQFSWYVHEGKTSRDIALPYLKRQTIEHCSFCDGFPVDNVSTETIEHFRPKCAAGFPNKAYSWTNLYYCCSQCQSQKREQWDDGLIAPDADDYIFGRYFEFDFTTGAIRPCSNASEAEQHRAKISIELYGLDVDSRRRARLLEERKWRMAATAERQLDVFAYRDYLGAPLDQQIADVV